MPPAFSGVGAAFNILSDAEKRAHYDRFGAEEGGAGASAGSSNAARAQHYARYEQELNPEDIFNMFFGGGLNGGGVAFRGGFPPQHFRAPQQRQHEQQQGGPRLVQFLQLLPLLLLFLFSLVSMRSGSEDRLFSLSHDDNFRTERKTSLYGVTAGLPYYVRDDFWSRVASDRSLMTRVRGGPSCLRILASPHSMPLC